MLVVDASCVYEVVVDARAPTLDERLARVEGAACTTDVVAA